MVPTLINKDVFEPSYDDLKFMVQTRDYICPNLNISCPFSTYKNSANCY